MIALCILTHPRKVVIQFLVIMYLFFVCRVKDVKYEFVLLQMSSADTGVLSGVIYGSIK